MDTKTKRRELTRSEALKSEKGIKSPPKAKKSSVGQEIGVKEGVNPPEQTISVYPFMTLLCCLKPFKDFVSVGNNKPSFTADDLFILLYIAFTGSRGIGITNLVKLMTVHGSSVVSLRNMHHKLIKLLRYGLLVSSAVGRNGALRYSLSFHAEKIFTSSVTKSDLRSLNKLVKDFMR